MAGRGAASKKPAIAIGGTAAEREQKSAPLLGGVRASLRQPEWPRTYGLPRQLLERLPKALRIAKTSLLNSLRREVETPKARKPACNHHHNYVRGVKFSDGPIWWLNVQQTSVHQSSNNRRGGNGQPHPARTMGVAIEAISHKLLEDKGKCPSVVSERAQRVGSSNVGVF